MKCDICGTEHEAYQAHYFPRTPAKPAADKYVPNPDKYVSNSEVRTNPDDSDVLNKRAKRGEGGKPVTLRMTDATRDLLLALGNGNLSAGVRIAVAKAKQ